MMQCTARSKRSGVQCKKDAVVGFEVCHMHGGKSPSGIASATLTTGKHSKYLPPRLMERYHEAMIDSDLLALREEIALVDTRLADLLSRVDTGEAGAAWKAAREAYNDLREAVRSNDSASMIAALSDLDSVLGRGMSDYAAWAEVNRTLEQRRRLVESERKRLIDMQQMITSEQAMLLVGALVGIIRARVHDRDVLSDIQSDLNGLLARQAGSGVVTG